MATNTPPAYPQARRQAWQVTNTLKKTVNFNDPNIASGVAFDESLPAGAFIISVTVEIVTAFNAGTTNVLTIGTNGATYNNIVASGDVTPGTPSVAQPTRGLGRSLAASAETPVFAKYTQTGTAATAGQAVVVIEYEGGWKS